MKRVDGIVGNTEDDAALAEAVAKHETEGTLERVVLDETDRKRSRLRVTTDAGTDLGVLVDQPELTGGDVLLLTDNRAVVVVLEQRDAFVIDLSTATATPTAVAKLGHRIGNQHWDLAVEGQMMYVPVEADRTIIESVLDPYIPPGATTHYRRVDASRFMDQREDSVPSHDHTADHDHSSEHPHEADRSHEHSHEYHHGEPADEH